MIKLFLLEDQYIIILGIKAMLRCTTSPINVVGYSNNVDQAVKEIHSSTIDIILLDLSLENADPVKNIRRLKLEFPHIPILIFSMENSLYWKIKMLFEGAQAYVIKDVHASELKKIINLAYQGITMIPPEVNRLVGSQNNKNSQSAITQEDLDIIFDLSIGMYPKQVASKYKMSVSSIGKDLAKIRGKVNVKTNPELISFFFGSTGYK
jgi:DNA-binding NarL/FixJ family response regulator